MIDAFLRVDRAGQHRVPVEPLDDFHVAAGQLVDQMCAGLHAVEADPRRAVGLVAGDRVRRRQRTQPGLVLGDGSGAVLVAVVVDIYSGDGVRQARGDVARLAVVTPRLPVGVGRVDAVVAGEPSVGEFLAAQRHPQDADAGVVPSFEIVGEWVRTEALCWCDGPGLVSRAFVFDHGVPAGFSAWFRPPRTVPVRMRGGRAPTLLCYFDFQGPAATDARPGGTFCSN